MTTLFEKAQAQPDTFEAEVALRLAEAEADARGVPVFVTGPPSATLQTHPIADITAHETNIEVQAHLFNLVGPLSPLPPAYTEIAARQTHRKAHGLTAFLDLFSDRFTWLFVAATEKYSLSSLLQWHRPERNRVLQALRSLIGFGSAGANDLAPLPDDQTLRYASVLAQRTRNAIGLRAMIAAELGLPVRVEQFHAEWRAVPESEQSRADGTAQLGGSAMAGAQIPDRSGQVRVVIGPLRYFDFISLEQGTQRLERLQNLIELYLGPVIDYDIQLILDRRDIPQAQLRPDCPPSLGWNTWARSREAATDSTEAIIRSRRQGAVT